MVFNFRGYGNSRGVPYQRGFMIDIQTILKELRTKVLKNLVKQYGQNLKTGQKLIFHGRSLGCSTALATAVSLFQEGNQVLQAFSALNIQFSGLILDSGFSSLANIGSEWLPFLKNCKEDVFHGENWDNLKALEQLVPFLKNFSEFKFLVVSCKDDEIVHSSHSEKIVSKL